MYRYIIYYTVNVKKNTLHNDILCILFYFNNRLHIFFNIYVIISYTGYIFYIMNIVIFIMYLDFKETNLLRYRF